VALTVLSFDRRLTDGADAARALRFLVRAREDPIRLLVEG